MKPGYKLTEIGVIPKDWEAKKISDFATIRMCKRIFAEQTTEDGDIPFYKIGTFGGKANAYISRKLYKLYKEKYSFPNEGDILISAAGTLGRTVVYDGRDAYYQDSNIVWLDIDKKQISNEYLNHYYKVIKWASSEGSTIARLYNGIIYSTLVACPPLPEQQRIAEALSDIDNMISSLEKLIEKKKAIKQGMMEQLLTGKVRLPGFEGEWENVPLEEVADLCTATIPADMIDRRHYVGTENMIPELGGVRDNDILIQYTMIREYRVGDILLSNIRPYLKKIWLANHDGGCSNDVLVIRTKPTNRITPNFLFYLLSQKAFFEYVMANAIGTKMPRGDKSLIQKFSLSIPRAIHEQATIVDIIAAFDNVISALSGKLLITQSVAKGMRQELLLGKKRI